MSTLEALAELLSLPERTEDELGAPAHGTGREALAAYVDGVAASLRPYGPAGLAK